MAKNKTLTPESLYDCDLEATILASVLFNPERNLALIGDILKPSDFFEERHGQLYEAMLACAKANEPVDVPFIKKHLSAKFSEEVFARVAGANSLVPVDKYAAELKERAIKRALLQAAADIPAIVDSDKSSREIVDEVSQEIYSLVESGERGKMKEAKQIVLDAFAEMSAVAQDRADPMNATTRIYSGFGEMDEKLGGFKGGDLVIVAARPGMGKTAFALNLASRVMSRGIGVVFFSLEMPATQLMYRLMSVESQNLPLTKIINVELNNESAAELTQVANAIGTRDFWVYDSADVGVAQVRTLLRGLKMRHADIGLCIIDYIGLMTNTASYSERHLQIGEISRGLKLLARELKMPIIALSQLNRNLESRANKRPMLSDLRESGSIEQDADTIMFVYRDDVYREAEARERHAAARARAAEQGQEFTQAAPVFERNPNGEEAEIIIGKNRNGPLGTIRLVYEPAFTRFKDPAAQPVAEVEFR